MALSVTDISFTVVTYRPAAQCSECSWSACPASVAKCKEHVLDTGHRVSRARITEAAYYVGEGKVER